MSHLLWIALLLAGSPPLNAAPGDLQQTAPAALVDRTPEWLRIPAGAHRAEPFQVAATPPTIELALYPVAVQEPDPDWSQWGDGFIGADGRFYSAIGDHGGPDGRSYIYAYDPQTRRLELAVDQQRLLDQQPGEWGFGKIHCRLGQLADGFLYWGTYWGQAPPEGHAQERRFYGSVVRADPATGQGEVLGAIGDSLVVPTGALDARSRLFYALPCERTWSGRGFLVFDLEQRKTIYHDHVEEERGRRFILVDEEGGGAYFSAQPDGERPDLYLARYDAATNTVDLRAIALPPGYAPMRAGTHARDPQGFFYVVCQGQIARIDPERRMAEAIGSLWGDGEYITTLAISPGGRYLYALPRAHGDAWKIGAPIVQYDLKTRTRKVLAFLGPHCRNAYGYLVGGSYCLELSEDGSRLYFGTNGSGLDSANPGFGLPASGVLHIPASERQDDAL